MAYRRTTHIRMNRPGGCASLPSIGLQRSTGAHKISVGELPTNRGNAAPSTSVGYTPAHPRPGNAGNMPTQGSLSPKTSIGVRPTCPQTAPPPLPSGMAVGSKLFAMLHHPIGANRRHALHSPDSLRPHASGTGGTRLSHHPLLRTGSKNSELGHIDIGAEAHLVDLVLPERLRRIMRARQDRPLKATSLSR